MFRTSPRKSAVEETGEPSMERRVSSNCSLAVCILAFLLYVVEAPTTSISTETPTLP